VENFNLEKTTNTIISFLDAFGKQWAKFVESMEKMGERINDAAREYEYLMSTRKNTLERSIRKIDELREKAGIETAPLRGGLPESPAPRTLKAPPEDAS
jgi:DNA anti-recombination protein RmuC